MRSGAPDAVTAPPTGAAVAAFTTGRNAESNIGRATQAPSPRRNWRRLTPEKRCAVASDLRVEVGFMAMASWEWCGRENGAKRRGQANRGAAVGRRATRRY